MNNPTVKPFKTFTSIKEAWEYYVSQMKPNEKEYHAQQRAFYAGAISMTNSLMAACEHSDVDTSFRLFTNFHSEGQRFATEQIKLHLPNGNN